MGKLNLRVVLGAVAALVLAAVLLVIVFWGNSDKNTKEETSTTITTVESSVAIEVSVPEQETVSYKIKYEEGKNAYEYVTSLDNDSDKDFSVTFSEFEFNGTKSYFITSLNGYTPDETQFWKFKINGTDSNLGVTDYEPLQNDTFQFEVDTINL